eukprot:Seg1452.4 transcript_id=Seg1452.4/GoldUCD/mRNA.D3Y31 product="Retrovirus-related Pol polyprotein from transposon 17.6" pseudo=true protein_id=Seg1452.4/GoldUCD/D3Y31
MSATEALQLQFEALVCQQSSDQLLKIVDFLKIKDPVSKKSKVRVVKIIRNFIETLISEPGETDVDVYLEDAVAFLTGKPPPLEKTEEEKELIALEKALLALQSKQATELASHLQKLKDATTKVFGEDLLVPSTSEASKPADTVVKSDVASIPSILRREFKISGQIGEPGQHDKLTYVSLIHQIDSAIEKGFTEREVTDGVIKSISPHSSLRNYILLLPSRSLSKLRQILRVFFQEKTASDLFQQLVTMSQEPKETAQQFLLKALDARNKVFFATREEDAQAEYNSQLVQKSFLKAFETGLRDENLVTNLRPFLRQEHITDEELMRNVNDLATKQAERRAKIINAPERQRAAKANASCVEFEIGREKNQGAPKSTQKESKNENEKLLAEIKELKSNLTDLKQRFDEKQSSPQYPPRFQSRGRGRGRGRGAVQGYSQRPRGCRSCQMSGWGASCDHCFKCGASGHFRDTNFPNVNLRDVSELIDCQLNVNAANGAEIPYKGWAEIEVKLTNMQEPIIVPFLVTSETIDVPLVGFNVIEEFMKSEMTDTELACVFPCVSSANINVLVDLIKINSETDLCIVKTSKRDRVVKQGQSLKIPCRLNHGPLEEETPVIFEPDENSELPNGLVAQEALMTIRPGKSSKVNVEIVNVSKHDIVIPKRSVIGRIELLQSVTPLDVKLKESPEKSKDTDQVIHNTEKLDEDITDVPDFIRDIDLNGLSEEQKHSALKVLSEERDSFAKDDSDIGCIPDLKLSINLTDNVPVQKNYVAVPRPLYPEVNAYIEDLLNRNFIKKSMSPYSSPVVCVRKKDQTLRLCVDYRALNQKTVPDQHPIPCIQESLDNLGEEMSSDIRQALTCAAQLVDKGEPNFITSLSTDPNVLSIDCLPNTVNPTPTVNVNGLRQAQLNDQIVTRLHYYVNKEPDEPLQSPKRVNRQYQPRRQLASSQTHNEIADIDSSEDSSSEDELFAVQNIDPSGQLNSNNSQSSDTNNVESQSDMTSAPSPPQTPHAEDEAEVPVHESEELPVENKHVEIIGNDLPQQENHRPIRIRQPPDRFAYYAPGHAVVNAVPMNINAIPQFRYEHRLCSLHRYKYLFANRCR